MNSHKLLQVVEELILTEFSDKLEITYDFTQWLEQFENISFEVFKILNEKYNLNINELKNDFLIKVMNAIFSKSLANGIKAWDKQYVRTKYEKKIRGVDIVYYPSRKAKKIVFNFSSMGKDRYDRYSRYWDESEEWKKSDTAYVFFKDDNYTYYLGDEEHPLEGIYFKLIKQFISMNNLSSEQAICVGGSMGGYGALYYAISLELNGAIVCAPQITYRATLAHSYRNWQKHIEKIGKQWCDLDMLLHRIDKIPNIYIEYGNYMADVLAVDSFINELKKRNESLTIIRKANWKEHTVDTVLSKDTVDKTIDYFFNHGFIFNEESSYR